MARYDIPLRQGDQLNISAVFNSAGTPIDLSGSSFKWTINGIDYIPALDGPAGHVSLEITGTDTLRQNLSPYHTLRQYDAGGNASTALYGTINNTAPTGDVLALPLSVETTSGDVTFDSGGGGGTFTPSATNYAPPGTVTLTTTPTFLGMAVNFDNPAGPDVGTIVDFAGATNAGIQISQDGLYDLWAQVGQLTLTSQDLYYSIGLQTGDYVASNNQTVYLTATSGPVGNQGLSTHRVARLKQDEIVCLLMGLTFGTLDITSEQVSLEITKLSD